MEDEGARLAKLEEENKRLREQLARLEVTEKSVEPAKSSSPRLQVPPSRSISIESDDEEAQLHVFPEFEGNKCVAIGLAPKKRRHRSRSHKNLSQNQLAKKKERNNRRHRRHKTPKDRPVVLLQSDASVLMPEGEDSIKSLKKEIQRKLETSGGVKVQVIPESEKLEELIVQVTKQHKDLEAFYLVDLGRVIAQYARWGKALPRVKVHYAIKANPDVNIAKTLHLLGSGYDCASKAEIEEALSIGVHPKDIIFANPCKPKQHLLFAKEKGILRMTFDNLDELTKIHSIYPEAHLVLRILPDDSHSASPLGTKFGATFEESLHLIEKSKELKMNLIGLSFHVGSGCYDPGAWVSALNLARKVFDEAKSRGFDFNLLDIGGGWPGVDTDAMDFEGIAKVVSPVLDELFPIRPGFEVIAEPGRYMCTQCYTLAVSIISKREKWTTPERHEGEPEGEAKKPERQVLYYLSDGLYGSFNNIVFDHAVPQPLLLSVEPSEENSHLLDPSPSPATRERIASHSRLFGPTCDSIDVVCADIVLPELQVGDWLYFVNMGAYTRASASSFNGFMPPNAEYFIAL